jgi:ribulose-5-phosphate 4-epimerase/fuculose-1-phosphate aldolase
MAVDYSTDFRSIRGDVSAQEWQTRIDLAACYRLVDHYGMSDLIYNHITARIPGTEHLLINLYGLLYKEITASSLVTIDLEGNIVWKPNTDYGINISGYVIHGAIHKARADVACVVHTHTRAGMAVAPMQCGLLPVVTDGDALRRPYWPARLRRSGDRSRRARAHRGGSWAA